MRIGLGIDTHQLVPGNSIRLAGVDIPSGLTIKAHSDGDIIYHSIADSILGAIGEGDIGDYFPDTDPKNKNLDSKIIVELAVQKAISTQFTLNNLDITLLLELPKIAEYKSMMKANIIEVFEKAGFNMRSRDSMINIKASTSESLGFIGKGEGVTCYCMTCLKDC